MATISISTRKTASGKRYDVRYRLGGRTYPVVRAGTFKTEREAKQRRDLVAGEIAHSRNPAVLLASLSLARATFEPFETWADRYIVSRIDLAENTRKMHTSHLRKFGEMFSDRDPLGITAPEIAEWISAQAAERKAGTVAQYLDCIKVFFDFVGAEPNPARDSRIKLPRRDTEEANPPSDEHYLAILDKLIDRWRLFFVTIEQGALRPGEAAKLTWGDVDVAGSRLRLSFSDTKTQTSRWVQLPQWLTEALEATCALEDRVPGRKVFQGRNESAARQAMRRACNLAKIPHYTPYDLRHRRATIWHHGGVPARELAARLGHSKPSMSLDVYTHVMPVADVDEKRLQAVLVCHGCDTEAEHVA